METHYIQKAIYALPYPMYSRLCLVLLNKWSSSRLQTGLHSATGKREAGKEADTVHQLVDALESRRRSVWLQERERGCVVPPPGEARREAGRENHVWTSHWAWRRGPGGAWQSWHTASLRMETEPPGLAGFSKVTASAFRAR